MNQDFEMPTHDVITKARQRLKEQAVKQGYKPSQTPEALLGDFWPEDESVDDFVQAIYQLRRAEAPL